MAGVGTNRYAYSNNDPVNKLDRGGNIWGLATKVGKIVLKGGDVAATFAGAAADVGTMFDGNASWGERALAAGSLATEVLSPVTARDAGSALNWVGNRVGSIGGFRKVKLTDFQAHHILPRDLATHGAVQKTGFKVESVANSINLPSKPDLHPTRSIHRGMHTDNYTERFEDFLDQVEAQIDSGAMSPEEGRRAIEQFVVNERGKLRSGETILNRAGQAQARGQQQLSDEGPTPSQTETQSGNEDDAIPPIND